MPISSFDMDCVGPVTALGQNGSDRMGMNPEFMLTRSRFCTADGKCVPDSMRLAKVVTATAAEDTLLSSFLICLFLA